ncbi:MAG: FG-GAP-like repeat-containing protein [Cyanobacteria bacterium P01_D01_bin.105]
MFDNNLGPSAGEESPIVSKDFAALRDPYGLDFNGDGRSDVLWHNTQTGETSLWTMAGESGNQVSDVASLLSTETGWQLKSAADFNQDGRIDWLVRNDSSGANEVWYLGGEQGRDRIGKDSLTGLSSDWDVSGVDDFDDDNRADILWQNKTTGQSVIWYLGGDSGTEVQGRADLPSPGADWKAQGLADFDGDGRTDVLWRDQTSGENLVWYMHGIQGTIYKDAERVETLQDKDWQVQGVGDFNQDGNPDIFWRSQSSGANIVWQMGGNKNNQRVGSTNFSDVGNDWMPIVTGWRPQPEAYANNSGSGNNSSSDGSSSNGSSNNTLDFNGDGRSDVLWHNTQTGETSLWTTAGESGNQVSDMASLPSIDAGWQLKSMADFNGDGRPDWLVRNSSSGANEVWYLGGEQGRERISKETMISLGSDWDIRGVGDFDADSRVDILWQNQNTGQSVIWYLGGDSGTELQGSENLPSPGAEWQAQGIADFDGDGRSDVLWRSQNTGENLIWYMYGAQGITYKDAERVDTVQDRDWQVEGVGDFNQDGNPDIFWRSQSSGANIVWQLGGNKNNQRIGSVRFSDLESHWSPIVTGWLPAQDISSGETSSGETSSGGDSSGGSDSEPGNNSSNSDNSNGDSSNGDSSNEDGSSNDSSDDGIDNSSSNGDSNSNGSNSDVDNSSNGDSPSDSDPNNDSSNNSANNSSDDGFNIEFDYRFDINNWYDSEKRAVLEQAADIWEAVILDEFENIPIGTTVHASDPNGGGLTSFALTSEIDDVRVFAFAEDLTSKGALAEAGATTYRGSDRNTTTVFQPWIGEVVFNYRESWYVGTDPDPAAPIPFGQADMLSVAVHELGHVLGISSGIDAFRALIENGQFTGEAATALNDGEPIPLDARGSHIADGFELDGLGENSLDPTIARGTRKLLTVLDVALLDDIGYSIDYSTLPAVPEIEVLPIQSSQPDTTKLRVDNAYALRWEDNFAEDVNIDLLEGNRYVRTIVGSTPSNGEFTWWVPPDLAGDTFYRIRISSVLDDDIFAVSDYAFRVEETPYIAINSPGSSTPLVTNTSLELTWSDNLRETVRIELYKDDSLYHILTASTQSDGSYQWTIPNWLETSDRYHLRFISTSDSTVYDESTKFWIQNV